MILYKVTTIMTQTSRIRDLTQKHITHKVEKVEKDMQLFLRKKGAWNVLAAFKMIVKYHLWQKLRLAEIFVK